MKEVFSFLFSLSPFFSITAAQGLLLFGIAYATFRLYRERKVKYPPFFLPLLAFAFFTLLSALFSLNPSKSINDSVKEIFIYLLPVVVLYLEEKWLKNGIVLGASIAALLGVLRFFMVKEPRLTGFVGHYMTEAGLMMMALLFFLGLSLFEPFRLHLLPAIGFTSLALLLTLTRSAWVGLIAGIIVIVYFWKKILIGAIPLIVLLVYLISPAPVKERAKTIFSTSYATNKDRICMWKSGFKIIRDYPWLGVGPNMIEDVYPLYREKDAVQATNPHLHNNFIQLAAERGLLAFTAFVLFLGFAFYHLILKIKRNPSGVNKAALAILIAFIVAGMFEYNFGDSEVKMLFLTFLSLPFLQDERKALQKT